MQEREGCSSPIRSPLIGPLAAVSARIAANVATPYHIDSSIKQLCTFVLELKQSGVRGYRYYDPLEHWLLRRSGVNMH